MIRDNFDLPKVNKMNINFELLKFSKMTSLKIYTSSHGKARNIKFGLQLNPIQRAPLGTLPQEVVMSLAHNPVTNLFISITYRLLLPNLGSKNNSLIWVHRALSTVGSNIITFWSRDIYKSLKGTYILASNFVTFINSIFYVNWLYRESCLKVTSAKTR